MAHTHGKTNKKQSTETVQGNTDIRLTRQYSQVTYFKHVQRTKGTLSNELKESMRWMSHKQKT